MAQSKAQNTYAQLGKYLMWCTRLSGSPDKNELAYICKMVKPLNQILQTIPDVYKRQSIISPSSSLSLYSSSEVSSSSS